MKTIHALLAAALGAFALAAPAAAADRSPEPHQFSFDGPFGSYDRAAVQRGFQVYMEVCSACHGMEHMRFRHLGDRGGPFEEVPIGGEMVRFDNPNDNPVVMAIAAEYMIDGEPDEFGDVTERPRIPADPFPYPYDNVQQGRAANAGAYPPDLSVITKARYNGAEYVRSLMLGYDYEPPADLELRAGNYYNPYMYGSVIAMPPQLQDGLISYEDGTEATAEQMAEDVAHFFAWASDPHMESRKSMGLMVMIYLIILAGLLFATYRQVWSKIEH
jgi:ubiquinol-cytochrome c reductase cytochrome c1 subunit